MSQYVIKFVNDDLLYNESVLIIKKKKKKKKTVRFLFSRYSLGPTPQKTPFLAAAMLQSDAAAEADRIENIVSNNYSIVACVSVEITSFLPTVAQHQIRA
jgi:hypothetical protein